MRSPARLVTGTAAAALTAAALGLAAAPSAHADVTGLGRPELTAVALPAPGTAECGSEYPEGTGSPDGSAACDTDATAADEPAPDAVGEPDIPEDLADTDPLDAADDPATLSGSLLPGTDEDPLEDPLLDDLGTGLAEKPGTRPEPLTPPHTDPGHAKPPTGRPTTPPGNRPSEPSGHVRTGVGGSAAPDTAQLAAGAGLVAAAAGSGLVLLRRRRSDGAHG
ncbi:hypothetical protein ACFYY2_28190 [Streptomyces sp. NPDC001822]|uniref:hypothetical protein n=1 Tax=Streptomyces sp. NPDC001822 TaxID=3364614 RepID=UPI0036A97CEC